MTNNSKQILSADSISRFFTVKSGGFFSQKKQQLAAVSDVSLGVGNNETLALVGESGSGKTTLSRMLLLLDKPSEGRIYFHGVDINTLNVQQKAQFRREIQPVFQNPYASLNPRMRVRTIVAEPLIVSARGVGEKLTSADIKNKVAWALEATGLRADDGDKFPHQFSGGQRQRIAIARAVACRPKLIVLDEPVSSQDISIQAQILNLLKDLQDELGMSYLFIAHDLATVRFMSDKIAVMYQGRIVESGDSEIVFSDPQHPYTKALFNAHLPNHPSENTVSTTPLVQRDSSENDINAKTEDSLVERNGCNYYNRCASAQTECLKAIPPLTSVSDQHQSACLYSTDKSQHSIKGKIYG